MKLSADELHKRLDALLAQSAPATAALDMDAFWGFIAALAQGRGIAERFHQEGLEAVKDIPAKGLKDPANAEFRKTRAYNIRVLQALVLAADRLSQASFLPDNFAADVIAADLLAMLQGDTGQGLGEPLILFSDRDGEAHRPEKSGVSPAYTDQYSPRMIPHRRALPRILNIL